MNYGERQLKINPANMDDIRNKTMMKEIDIRMSNMKEYCGFLQETHETISIDQETENYRYISTAAQPTDGATNGKGIGGVASLVKKGWRINIMGITWYSHRCVKVKIRTNMSKKTIHLINTYAPHMWYKRNERDTYWREMKYILDQIPKAI